MLVVAFLPGFLTFAGSTLWLFSIYFSRPLRVSTSLRRFEKQKAQIQAFNDEVNKAYIRNHAERVCLLRDEHEKRVLEKKRAIEAAHKEKVRILTAEHHLRESEQDKAYAAAVLKYEDQVRVLTAEHQLRESEQNRVYAAEVLKYEQTVRVLVGGRQRREEEQAAAFRTLLDEYEERVRPLTEENSRREAERIRSHEFAMSQYEERVRPLIEEHRAKESERTSAYKAEVEKHEESVRTLVQEHRNREDEQTRAHEQTVREIEAQYLEIMERWKQEVALWAAEREKRQRLSSANSRLLIDTENEWTSRGSAQCEILRNEYDRANKISIQLNQICSKYSESLVELTKRSREAQLRDYLENRLIRNEKLKIKGLTSDRLANLESCGVKSAATVGRLSQVKVPGIGPVISDRLLEWKEKTTASFVYDPHLCIPASERQRLDAQYRHQLRSPADSLASSLIEIRSLLDEYNTEKTHSIEKITGMVRQLMQAIADAKIMD
jgi:hypothetical protein